MRAKSFINVPDFCDKYGISDPTARSHIRKMPSDAIVTIGSRETYIDEKHFTRRREFKKRVQHESQEIYYFLSAHFSDFHIAATISKKLDNKYSPHSIHFFLGSGLFRLDNDQIVNYEVPEQAWNIWRVLRWIAMRVFNASRRYNSGVRRYGLIKAIEKINDQRMIEDAA